jgi:peptidoglycan/LPS O-acetylase OafA/YrhL
MSSKVDEESQPILAASSSESGPVSAETAVPKQVSWKQRIREAWDIKRNWHSLVTQESDNFRVLNGIRAFAVIWVIFAHVLSDMNSYVDDPYINAVYNSPWMRLFRADGYAVDAFFVLSGFLIAYILSGDFVKQRFSLGRFYFRRFLRIAPSFYLTVILWWVVGYFYWDYQRESCNSTGYELGCLSGCAENADHRLPLCRWSNFLFIHNYVGRAFGNICVYHSWSIAVLCFP